MHRTIVTILKTSAVLLWIGCTKHQALPPAHKFADTTVLSYLALGDSYTAGQSVPESQRFADQTVGLLWQDSVRAQPPAYIARTGWTTANLQSGIVAANITKTYDVVSLLIGTNDQYQHLDTAGYRNRFTQLLEQAIGFTGGRKSRVFVLSMPDYSATPFVAATNKSAVRRDIDAFNAINREISEHHQVKYIDVTPSTREAANDPSLIASDSLHPSGKEYAKWARMLADQIKSAVTN